MAISALPGFTLPNDISASAKYYAEDIIDPPVTAEAGNVVVPDSPGLGAEVREEVIAEHAAETRQFSV